MNKYKIDTQCVQAGYKPKNGEPRVLPITQSTTFHYDSGEQVGRLFDLEEEGFFYTRLANPTMDAVEKKIAALEGGVGAMCTSSGQAALLITVLNICNTGDHIIASNAIYGGSLNLLGVTLERMGINTTFVPTDTTPENLEKEIKSNTKAIFAESLSNPALEIIDMDMFAEVARKNQIPLIIDNTFATPINCQPIKYGANVVIHSTSKYMDGHAVALGGVIVDAGNFDWANGKFPGLSTKDDSYHGIVYTDTFGAAAFITKARVQLLRDLGSTPSPNNAFLLNLGLETLALRVERHCSNAQAAAEYLAKSDYIEWVNYPGLSSNKFHKRAQKYMPKGSCGVVTFGVKGGKEAALKFMNNLELASIVVHVADVRTSVLHPASTTHRQLTNQQLEEAGISANLVRLSVGIENIEDIIADIEQAFAKLG